MAVAVTFGEIMMRLATPGHQRFVQATEFEISYAGAEASVAVSLAAFGHQASLATVLPNNPLGDACLGWLRYYGVDPRHVRRSDTGRMGVYFLEAGAAQRPSKVVYDRAGSAITLAPAASYDWPAMFDGVDWFHTTGITPALGPACAEATASALKAAKTAGLQTSFDINYRGNLWSKEVAQKTVEPMLASVDLVIANEQDAADVLGIHAEKTDISKGQIDRQSYEGVARQIQERYGCAKVAITLRESESATINHWSACLLDADGFHLSQRYTIHVVDRVGAGDAFCGGMASALLDGMGSQEALEFAVAASCLKHSIPGDFNKVTKAEVLRLSGGDGSGRVVR
ncbi:sugar kinase [Lignipirellula cremea]|uniref:2-dehydro-3-deoxygluconokinase n=1 Tax=Lignipirellula cremea TaxID=2528010 RepID=A0A518DVS3_9BACT|nr:sugar kinase [Lignipirellula cremea]QDU95937.1 2-dehydro-3-deoxygluconokinase [Lignipirellula cremea]